MLVKLGDHSLESRRIDKETIKIMVDFYRVNRMKDKKSMKFAHFPITEVLQLFVDNGIIPQLTESEQEKAASFGLKLYMANHANDITTVPDGRTDYLPYDTIIVCNTQQMVNTIGDKTFKTWTDMLNPNITVIQPDVFLEGEGLDKTTICPPDCPSLTNHDNMDISAK